MNDEPLESALKRNRARQILAGWKASFSTASGVPMSQVDFVSPEETAILKAEFFCKVRRAGRGAVKLSWPTDRLSEVLARLDRLSREVADVGVVLFSSVDQLIGAVRVPAEGILRNAMPVWRVVENDLCLATEDLASGLCLEHGYYDLDGQYDAQGVYELTAWGDFSPK